MVGALIIVFREVIEAGLIVGIVLAATRAIPGRALPISAGVAAGVVGACGGATFAGAISNAFAGAGQELLNACILLLAVVMLTWHNVWMARHGRELAMEAKLLGDDVSAGRRPIATLAVVVALAVLREGSEVVLFLYGVMLSAGESGFNIATGATGGLLLGASVAALSYFGLLAIPTRHLFRITSILIALLAAGMASQAMTFLRAGGFVDVLGGQLWNSSALLPQSSLLGRALQTLVGYSEAPTELQLLAYVATLLTIALLMRLQAAPIPVAPHTARS